MVGKRKGNGPAFKVPRARKPLRPVVVEESGSDGNSESDNTTVNSASNTTAGTLANVTGGQEKSVYLTILHELSPIFEASQQKHANRDILTEEALDVYKKYEKKSYANVLWRMMIIPFQVKDKQETVERMIGFFHHLLNAIFECDAERTTVEQDSQEDENDNTNATENGNKRHKFRDLMLRLCEKSHQDERPQVRMRVVQTMVKIFDSTPTLVDEISAGLKKRLTTAMLERLMDKIHTVRCEAAKGLCHFQGGKGCPVTRRMMEFIRMDPKPEVRKALVYSIVLDKDDYGDFLDRVVDVHPEVRKACVHQIREIPLSAISLENREKIIECGLRDSSPAVRSETTKLIYHWFKECKKNPATLVQQFDVYNRSKLCTRLLNVIFADADEESWAQLENDLLVDKLLPLDSISEVKMYIWWYLFTRFHDKPYFMEKLTVSMPAWKSYFKKVLGHLQKQKDMDDDERVKIMVLLLKILDFVLVEEAGRMVLDEIIREAFKCKFYNSNLNVFVKQLVLLLHKAHPTGCDEILLENLRDMMEIQNHTETQATNGVIAHQRLEEEIRKMKIALSGKLHNKFHLDKQKKDLVDRNKYLEAHKLQEEINDLETDIASAREEIRICEEKLNARTLEEQSQEPTGSYSSHVLFNAFSALRIHLKLVPKISPYIRNFYEAQVSEAILRPEAGIRSQVLEIMTLVGDFSLEDATAAMQVCLQAVTNDEEQVKQTALQCIFDLVLKYGIESFESLKQANDVANTDEEEKSEANETQTTSISKASDEKQNAVDHMIMQLLMSFFKSNVDENTFHVAVLGMLKLLIMGRIGAPKIVATLLTMWADSSHEGSKYYHDIGAGLSVYTQQSCQNAEVVARALTPSVSKVLQAQARQSIKRVDPEKLFNFVIMQTDQSKLGHFSTPFMPHQIIAFDVLDEIRRHPFSTDNITFAKATKSLSLNGISKESLQQLKTKLKHVMRNEVKSVCQNLTVFGKYLDELDPEIKAMEQISDVDSDSGSDLDETNGASSQSMFQSWRAPVDNTRPNLTTSTVPGLESVNSSLSKTVRSRLQLANDSDDDDFMNSSD